MVSRRNSPGVLKDIVSSTNRANATVYLNTMKNLKNTSLHAKLITIGDDLGYYDKNDNDGAAGTTFSARLNVLNNYLQNVAGYSGSNYTLDYINYNSPNTSQSNTVKNYIINKIQQGRPVLISISGTQGGHVAVAYEYDSTTDSIYTNMGWFGAYTHITPESQGFITYKSALVIDWNISHVHTNNYSVVSGTQTNFYCFESSAIDYYDHDGATCTYQQINDNYNQHSTSCTCGWIGLQEHCDLIIGFPNPSVTCGRCSKWLM